jgi:hypothetical protein
MDKKHKRYYIGCHWGDENDGYICSSTWMLQAYKKRPQDFKRKILERYDDRSKSNEIEHRWLQMMKPEELKGVRYYNIHNYRFGHWSSDESSRLTVGEKISLSHRSNPNWGQWSKGRVVSEETKKKISASVSIQMTPERRSEISKINVGYKHTEEARSKIADRSRHKTHKCETCGEYFAPGPYQIHVEWANSQPRDKYLELKSQGLSYRKIAAIFGTDHKNIKKSIDHKGE